MQESHHCNQFNFVMNDLQREIDNISEQEWNEAQSIASHGTSGGQSLPDSLFTQSSSRDSSHPNEPSSEQRRLEQRQKQIDYGRVKSFKLSH